MVFNSIFFIFCFLPVFMLVYYLVPGKLRNLILFLGSLIFYAWGEPVYVVLMLFSSVFNYYMGTELERLYDNDRKQKHNLIFAILVNLGILVFFKRSEESQELKSRIRNSRFLSGFPSTRSVTCPTCSIFI